MINEWALDRMLTEVGLRTEDVETIVMPFPDALAGFGGGSVDASIMPEPFGTIGAVRGLAVRLMDADEYIAGGQVAVMVYSEAFVRQRTAVGRRWAVAYLHGVRDFMDAMEDGRDRQSVIRHSVIRSEANSSPVSEFCITKQLHLIIRDAQIIVRVGKLWLNRNRFFESFDCALVLPRSPKCLPQSVVCGGVLLV